MSLTDRSDLVYWTYVFGVSAERLREVIAQVGPSIEDVRKRIGDSTLVD